MNFEENKITAYKVQNATFCKIGSAKHKVIVLVYNFSEYINILFSEEMELILIVNFFLPSGKF